MLGPASPVPVMLIPPNRQHWHDLDGIAGEDREMRMLLEHRGGGLVRIRAHHREGAHVNC